MVWRHGDVTAMGWRGWDAPWVCVMVLSGRRTPEVTVVWGCEPVWGLDGVGVMGVRSPLLELLLTCGMLC